MAKSILLPTGRSFKNIAEGKRHFAALLKSIPLGKEFSGDDFEDLNAVYVAYCKATDWALLSHVVSFFPTHETGDAFTTRCFGMKFADDTVGRFSIQKALSKIAT